jgi:hypothetical protein
MQTIFKSGSYKTNTGEPFLITQDTNDGNLISGKECLLRFFPNPKFIPGTDFVQIRISCESVEAGVMTVQKRCYCPVDIFNLEYHFDILIKAFILIKSGNYGFSFSFKDRSGKELTKAEIPTVSFSYDVECWVNHLLPNGLVI